MLHFVYMFVAIIWWPLRIGGTRLEDMQNKVFFSDVNACEKSIATIHAIENERKARDKDWIEAKTLKEKLQDPEVDKKMEDLIQLQSKMIDVNQKQLTNLQIGKFWSIMWMFAIKSRWKVRILREPTVPFGSKTIPLKQLVFGQRCLFQRQKRPFLDTKTSFYS